VRTLLRRRWPEHRYLLEVGGDPASAREVITSAVGRAVEFSTVEGLLSFSLNKQEPISSAVAALVHSHIQVRAVIPRWPTIQDLYFATINDGSAA
uniref:hypothetical protein n=1 Tax=Streptomyces sp. NRRL F-6674 TaxID=1463877 RepID=UPI0005256F0F